MCKAYLFLLLVHMCLSIIFLNFSAPAEVWATRSHEIYIVVANVDFSDLSYSLKFDF